MSSVFFFQFSVKILGPIFLFLYMLILHGRIETTDLTIVFSSLISTTLIKLSLKNNQENKNVIRK